LLASFTSSLSQFLETRPQDYHDSHLCERILSCR
jgi:hypothetical protein